ncbi:hypothetical protein K3495_g12575 [Podosphaera aphanis]|nr:hypothetical protein K3495_g12575 [Podosphaera aphanis]
MLSNLLTALKNPTPEITSYLDNLMKGKNPTAPESSRNQSASGDIDSFPGDRNLSMDRVIKRDANFEKWDGESLSWTPHYYFLKVQCEVYEPLLVSQKAVCMKICESTPEPKRQRIRGYWIKCGETGIYDWKEMLEACNKEYFDRECELQLEFAGGRRWPDDIKINRLSIAVSEKIRDKFSVLDLPTEDYQNWVNIITRVTAVMENSEKFVRKGEARTTQYATRSGMLVNEYLAGQVVNKESRPLHTNSVDHDGDTVMGGMKIVIHSIAALVAKMNLDEKNGRTDGQPKLKPAAPWRTEKEVSELHEKGLCLRCKKKGHFSRTCRIFGPPKRPELNHMNSLPSTEKIDVGSEFLKD